MPKRLATLAALFGVTVLMLALMPVTPASAESWWQVLSGSRPTNMWEPTDSRQKITSELGGEILFGEIKVAGNVIGCLGAGSVGDFITADEVCQQIGFGPEATETAAELEALLEGVYGTSAVEVTGGPAGSAPLLVTVPGRGVPPIEIPRPIVGQASAETLSLGGSGRLVLTVTNLGDDPVDATGTPVQIVDHLPAGVVATGFEALAGGLDTYGPVDCAIEASDEVVCNFEGKLPSHEAIEVEIFASLLGSPPVAGAPGEISVSGGNASSVRTEQAIEVSPEPTPFGVEHFSAQAEEDGGGRALQAGGHPFQFTTTVQLNAGPLVPTEAAGLLTKNARPLITQQPGMPRNLRFPLPAGFVGNATVVPQCEMDDFSHSKQFVNRCADDTALGIASVTVIAPGSLGMIREAVPVFNLPPALGQPARFGFLAAGVPVVIDTAVDPDDENRIVASVSNVSQLAQLLSATTTFWGTPGDPRHDPNRGWRCAYFGNFENEYGACEEHPPSPPETAFLRQPVQCSSPLDFGLELEPWNVPLRSRIEIKSVLGDTPLRGCSNVPFAPDIASAPTSKLAENPSGLDFRLEMPNSGLLNKDAVAEGQPKKVEVTLPEGMSINPSEGEGLVGCSEAEFARETARSLPGEGCPNASKVGTVDISTPLLEEEAHGALYVAAPFDNPTGSLVGLYMVARIPDRGVVVKQAGSVTPDPLTGQLTTVFDDLPQLPFSSFKLHFREGGRAPLVTPPACGTYDITARFVPWSSEDPDHPAPGEVVTETSTFTVERGVDGGACPAGGVPSFHPGLDAGTLNNAAGRFSPFNLRLTRKDGEQEFTNFSIKLPPGLSGKLAGVPFCPDAGIAAAKARTGRHGGQEELEAPSCPAASEIGHTLVGAGVGTTLTYVPGKVYLAGPYHGSPLSIAAITAAKVGPFDLGTVVVREALRVNPETAEVFIDATGSDPIPHIIQGIPVHARDIRVYVDRPEFTLNPTSCEPSSVASTVLGSGLDFGSAADDSPVTVTTRFQAADCAALRFKPKLKLRLKGPTHRGANPKLRATLNMRGFGESAISRASVTLPHSEFLDQSHIRTVCTRAQFNAGAGNGTECPPRAVYGYARAWTPILDQPIKGPVFLRSSSHPLPDLVAAMHGQEIDINLVGRIDSIGSGRIRNTFEAVPDAPVTKFVLEMQGGKKGLLENSTEICRGSHRALAVFDGHNGKSRTSRLPLEADCGGRKKQSGRR